MGIKLFSDSPPYQPPNPHPSLFTIINIRHKNGYTYAEVAYFGCTPYDGVKIMIYEGDVTKAIAETKHLDPHFLEEGDLIPVARFAPTPKGRALAELVLDQGHKIEPRPT